MTIMCESESENGGTDIAGYFDWANGDTNFGREFFSGTIGKNLEFDLHGFALQDSHSIINATYLGTLSSDHQIFDGEWLEGRPGVFTASRSDREARAEGFEQLPCTLQNGIS